MVKISCTLYVRKRLVCQDDNAAYEKICLHSMVVDNMAMLVLQLKHQDIAAYELCVVHSVLTMQSAARCRWIITMNN